MSVPLLYTIFSLHFAALLVPVSSCAFHPITVSDHLLVDRVIEIIHQTDWLTCISACQENPECASYNFQLSAVSDGFCELSYDGVQDLCAPTAKSRLLHSSGFVYQQLRPSQVRCLEY